MAGDSFSQPLISVPHFGGRSGCRSSPGAVPGMAPPPPAGLRAAPAAPLPSLSPSPPLLLPFFFSPLPVPGSSRRDPRSAPSPGPCSAALNELQSPRSPLGVRWIEFDSIRLHPPRCANDDGIGVLIGVFHEIREGCYRMGGYRELFGSKSVFFFLPPLALQNCRSGTGSLEKLPIPTFPNYPHSADTNFHCDRN